MPRPHLALGLAAALATSGAAWAIDTAPFTKEQSTLLGRFGNAWLSTRECDFTIDEEGVGREARRAFGPTMPTGDVVRALALIHEPEDFTGELLFAPADAKKKICAEMLGNFGPQGAVVRGLIKP